MHTITITTKFRFGDRVKYKSRLMGCAGVGTIVGITLHKDLPILYEIDEGPPELIQPGILEDEIVLVDPQPTCLDT